MKPNAPAPPSMCAPDLFEPLRAEQPDYADVQRWLCRIEARPRHPHPHVSRGIVIGCVLLFVGFIGCLPVQQRETVGHVTFWTKPGVSLEDTFAVSGGAGAAVPHPSRPYTRYVALFDGARSAEKAEQAAADARAAGADSITVYPVVGEFDRRAYQAFLSSLPRGIQGNAFFFTSDQAVEHALIREQLEQVVKVHLNTDEVLYWPGMMWDEEGIARLSFMRSRIRSSIQQDLLDRYDRLSEAITALEEERDPRLQEARAAVEAVRRDVEDAFVRQAIVVKE